MEVAAERVTRALLDVRVAIQVRRHASEAWREAADDERPAGVADISFAGGAYRLPPSPYIDLHEERNDDGELVRIELVSRPLVEVRLSWAAVAEYYFPEADYRRLPSSPKSRAGRPDKYDWKSFNLAAAGWLLDNGIPDPKADLHNYMADWCHKRWGSETPAFSTIRVHADACIENFKEELAAHPGASIAESRRRLYSK